MHAKSSHVLYNIRMTEGSSSLFSLNEILGQIPVSALWFILVVFLVLFIIMGIALVFHWNKYKLHSPATDMTQLVYLSGLFILVALSAASLIFFNTQ